MLKVLSEFYKIIENYSFEDKKLISQTFALANEIHKNQKRKSGERYIIHPIAVACMVANMHADVDTICAALLHDTVEDSENFDLLEIENRLGDHGKVVASLVDGLTKIDKKVYSYDKEQTDAANFQKIVLSILSDVRIIILKIADRLHNMSTLEYQPFNKQIEISNETLTLYAKVSGLIGEYKSKCTLEDYCLKYLHPEEYKNIHEQLAELEKEYEKKLVEAIYMVSYYACRSNMNIELDIEPKPAYEIYKMITDKGYELRNIPDLFVVYLTTNTEENCYKLEEFLHRIYEEDTVKIKDYIKQPKFNMYRSLHFTVAIEQKYQVQFKIQTDQMLQVNLYGLPAYWSNCKDNDAAQKMQATVQTLPFYHTLLKFKEMFPDTFEFENAVKKDILNKRIIVDVAGYGIIEIPGDSTVTDLIYYLNENNENQQFNALVNNVLVPNNTVLHNLDQITYIPLENSKIINNDEKICNTALAQALIRRKKK